ncbi:hypothetical protein MKW94_007833 [Papaver nudicaule]|uniref:25S rRNA (uridine-N(3))-methyltransferase BMT5-like domain-containing protein n=1 Tax=Papaver nudicaule TaxID=74823 RepID=A0AA41SQ18_PAPNU|nr:hypothetical protein [Papaver nudicaule]
MHKKLLSGFFKSASKMLNKPGEIHVSHKNDYPYNKWEIKKLANNAGLQLEKQNFKNPIIRGTVIREVEMLSLTKSSF